MLVFTFFTFYISIILFTFVLFSTIGAIPRSALIFFCENRGIGCVFYAYFELGLIKLDLLVGLRKGVKIGPPQGRSPT